MIMPMFFSNKLVGTVEHGLGKANKIGFPTANLVLNKPSTLPNGQFTGFCYINNKKYNCLFRLQQNKVAFVYIKQFSGDLYKKELTIYPLKQISKEDIQFIQHYYNFLDKIHSDNFAKNFLE